MPIRSYSTVHLVIPLTPKTVLKIYKITEDITRRFGGSTISRVAIPSPFIGNWVTVRNGEKVIVPDDLTLITIDIDIGEHPDYLDYFETFQMEKMNETHQDYLGEDEIWITVYNSYRITHGTIDTIVRHSNTNEAINGVQVSISGPLVQEKSTDHNGVVIFRGLPDGRYTMTAFVAEFRPANAEVLIATGNSVNVNLFLVPHPNV